MLTTSSIPVITIDGPSGAGKGTVSRMLARELGFHFLDSGALYRLLAFAAQRRGIGLDDVSDLVTLSGELDIRFAVEGQGEHVWLDGKDVSDAIRTEAAGAGASRVAVLPAVREALLNRQRRFRVAPGLVADGRDMGTVVFPDADVKVFLVASAEERARRRYKQLKEKGICAGFEEVLADIRVRDERDAGRSAAPLRPADDAELLDTTELDIPSTMERLRGLIDNRLNP